MKRGNALDGPERYARQLAERLHPGNTVLRRAIQENVVSFPSQVPALVKGTGQEAQWRAAVLFLVHGWPMRDIARRVDLPVCRISTMVREWSIRAFAIGYIQVIDAERLAELCGAFSETNEADLPSAACAPARASCNIDGPDTIEGCSERLVAFRG